MLKQQRVTVQTAEDLAEHLNSVFASRVTVDTFVLSAFDVEFLPQLANHLQHSCGRTFDPRNITKDTTITKLHQSLHS